ncbi:hypothetical protein STEG23_016001 [Scotinomys teguina]
MVQQTQSLCMECQGHGERISPKDRCKSCNGRKIVREKKILEVHIDKVATWPIACGSTLFHYMVTSSIAGWRLLFSSRTGLFSSCCLALDSSSSFPCPAFRAITKSMFTTGRQGKTPESSRAPPSAVTHLWTPKDLPLPPHPACIHTCKQPQSLPKTQEHPGPIGPRESSPPPTPRPEQCNVDKAEENDRKNSLMKMLEEAFEGTMKMPLKKLGKDKKKLEEINKEIEEKN